jgi:hypothetical protein
MFAGTWRALSDVKLVPGHKFKIAVGASQRGLQAGMKKAVGLDHDHAGSAALRMAIGYPKEGHPLSLVIPADVAKTNARGEDLGPALKPCGDTELVHSFGHGLGV